MEQYFEQAAGDIKTHGKNLSNENMLKLYGLYKQATVGDINIAQPGMFDMKGKAKWNAWNQEKGKTTEVAKREYVQEVLKYLPEDVKTKYV